MSTAAVGVPGRHARAGGGDLLVALPVARGFGFAALAAWGALHWMSMLEPAEPARGWAAVGVGLLAMVLLLLAARVEGARRAAVVLAGVAALLALMLLAGGARDELLAPSRWGELAGGISRGISDLPGVRVPYRGIDPWVRLVIGVGGSALVLLAALFAFWPRRSGLGRPIPALAALIVLYVTPVVALEFDGEFLRGAVFALLTIAFLRLEKLRMPDAGAAGALVLLAMAVALGTAPLLNRDQPWWDYETWALETAASKSTVYTWDHTYGPLDWPRDGRELLRVKAKTPAYWKTENLDTFDGSRWLRAGGGGDQSFSLATDEDRIAKFTQTIRVSVRNLRSEEFITSGYATLVDLPNVDDLPTDDGLFLPARPLRRGDTYTAQVYNPRPTTGERERAGIEYPPGMERFRSLTIPVETQLIPGVRRVSMTFPAFGDSTPLYGGPPAMRGQAALDRLHASPLGAVYDLAQSLKQGARTPEDFVQRVISYLGDGFVYSEAPPPSARTLPGFLLTAKQGYCQQFSGAMALLLRMGGVPARVSTGFSPGATDPRTDENVVRDFDAHSWTEVYYPGWGWYTYDPTPADSPARAQADDRQISAGGGSAGPPRFGPGDAPSSRADGTTAAGAPRPWWHIPALAGTILLAAAAVTRRARRRRGQGAPTALSELERALRRTRLAPAPQTTLSALEQRFAHTPAAADYVRTLRDARYRDVEARPTREQRRGLRTELARGGGLAGRLRAWWALPPR